MEVKIEMKNNSNNIPYYTIKINSKYIVTMIKEVLKIVLLLFLVGITAITTSYLIWPDRFSVVYYLIFIIIITTLICVLTLKFYPISNRFYMIIPISLGLLIAMLGAYQCTRLHIESIAMYEFYYQKRLHMMYIGITCMIVSTVISKLYLMILKKRGGYI